MHLALALPGYLLLEFGVDFYIEAKLGAGGFSSVHRGHAVSNELQGRACFQPVAVKVMTGMFSKYCNDSHSHTLIQNFENQKLSMPVFSKRSR